MKRILVSPLSWGLGHATRDLPIIRDFLSRGHHVTVAAEGRALALLKQEVPQCDFVELRDYPPPYSASQFFVPKFLAMAPAMLKAIAREARGVKALLEERKFDLILSDNRFNVRSHEIPSFVISHQLRFMTPPGTAWFEPVTEYFNYRYLRPFDRIIVPDLGDEETNLAGRLAHQLTWLARTGKVYYAGVLASTARMKTAEDVDVFVSISGPEPPRTQLERIMLDHIPRADAGRVVIALGQPEVKEVRQLSDRITVHGYLDRAGQQEMLNRAKLVVCRSGYTTVMELAELGKKALLIPTPGQTEQEYLGRFYAQRGYFHSVSQYALDLTRDLDAARKTGGVPFPCDTKANVERLYRELFAPILGQ
jgi:UDP:flavonoid glycosyltransferase YjiC (YdhE family)